MHFLPAGTGIWPPAFPLRSPRGRCIPLQLPGLCSPWRAVHSLPARRGGPCNTKPGAGAPFFCIPLLPPASRACNGRWGIQKNRMIFIIRFLLRRGRDSNPRILSDQRFSRPPQSTTLPPLLPLWDCKCRNYFLLCKNKLLKM